MPRPKKAGLDYYYKGVHEWDDIEMIELVQKYGPLGYTIYEVVRSKVYESGYYLDISLDRLAGYVIRTVGNRWIRDKSIVLQVIRYCAEIGLFDNALLAQSVVTSASIQAHYSEVTARSKADKSQYWLLGESEKTESPAAQPFLPAKEESAAKTEVYAAKTPEKTAKTPQSKANKSKPNQTKVNQSKAAANAAPQNAAEAAAAPPDEVEEAYYSATGHVFRKADHAALKEMRTYGASDALIIRTISAIARRGNENIGSMRYFLPIVRESLQKKKGSPSPPGTNEKRGLMPATSETEEIENLLNDEWQSAISRYTPMQDEDYY